MFLSWKGSSRKGKKVLGVQIKHEKCPIENYYFFIVQDV